MIFSSLWYTGYLCVEKWKIYCSQTNPPNSCPFVFSALLCWSWFQKNLTPAVSHQGSVTWKKKTFTIVHSITVLSEVHKHYSSDAPLNCNIPTLQSTSTILYAQAASPGKLTFLASLNWGEAKPWGLLSLELNNFKF